MDSDSTAPEASATIETTRGENLSSRYIDLFLVSFAILFFELACIRWFGSTVIFLTFFTNLVLLACFLGMSVGLMTAGSDRDYIRWVFPLAFLAVSFAVVMSSSRVSQTYVVDVGTQKSPQEVFFGTEPVFGSLDTSRWVIPVEALAGSVFVLIALSFLGLGQVMGRAFDAIPNRVLAYTVDILGSLTGIAVFGLMSWLWTPPILWFAIALLIGFSFIKPVTWPQTAAAIAILMILGLLGYRDSRTFLITWSPYYKVQYAERLGRIQTNNIGHQQMVAVGDTGSGYFLPHLLNRDAGNGPFKNVMIVGAGSGNDVSAALQNGAEHVDAVEIEPALNEIGRNDHPKRPYQDSRVSIILDDGRSAVRKSDKKYDLIAYALVDSLVLHSGYSSLRLESFLFTEQAFRDVKEKLGDDGVFVMSNYYRQGWIVGRLVEMAKKVFDAEPIVIGLPYRPEIKATDSLLGNNFTFVIVGKKGSKSLESIRTKFEADKYFWLSGKPTDNLAKAMYASERPDLPGVAPTFLEKIGPAKVDTAGIGPTPTDDWPFLYLREPRIPGLNLRGIALVAVLSLAILFSFAPIRTIKPSPRMFFLGAGFMLLETKGVVHLALLFGSTWVVNSVVFFAILVMILISNLFVLKFQPQNLTPYYIGLLVALLVNAFVPMDVFLGLPGAGKVAASCLVVFIPILFAGVIFATSFSKSTAPDVDFGSNVAGVILGGLSENISLILGFDQVLLLAIAFYLLSAVLGPRLRPQVA